MINFSATELAQLLVELHAEGEILPPGAFDELAEATFHLHEDACCAVLETVDPSEKLSLGLALARSIVADAERKARAGFGRRK